MIQRRRACEIVRKRRFEGTWGQMSRANFEVLFPIEADGAELLRK
jgi:hypothetical protein